MLISLFAPTPELLKWWKASAQDTEAKLEYERPLQEILQSRQQLIDLWMRKQQQASVDVTLLCSLEDGGFLPQAYRWAGGSAAITPASMGRRS
jgi:hypothetical protein